MESEEILTSFRQEWQRELVTSNPRKDNSSCQSTLNQCHPQSNSDKSNSGKQNSLSGLDDDDEIKAAELFNHGVWLEQRGEVYNAIKYYKRAIALIPDIEFRVYRQNILSRAEGAAEDDALQDMDGSDDINLSDLVSHFEGLLCQTYPFCEQLFAQQAAHISCLPVEMLDRILSWVVSDELDLQSLDKLSGVCRGFFILCRNPDIWKRACFCIWGINTGDAESYGSWRDMFIFRPRLRFNGCYISRTTYFRKGEASFQDATYEPYQFVSYYRYMRFFPNGLVLMLTTAEEPQSVVGLLRKTETKYSQVMSGHYRLYGNTVTILFRRFSGKKNGNRGRTRRKDQGTTDVSETSFKIEMEIKSARRKLHCQLTWQNYTIVSVFQSGAHTSSTVDVSNVNSFPSLLFSKVKSYCAQSEAPLP